MSDKWVVPRALGVGRWRSASILASRGGAEPHFRWPQAISRRCGWRARSHQEVNGNHRYTEYGETDMTATSDIQLSDSDTSERCSQLMMYSLIKLLDVSSVIRIKWPCTGGLLCDRRVNKYLKFKGYGSIVRSIALYRSECWMPSKGNERCPAVEMKMILWIKGMALYNHARSRDNYDKYGVALFMIMPSALMITR